MRTKNNGQQKWIQEILKKLSDLSDNQAEPFNRDPEWPEWVVNLWMMVMGISHPGCKLKSMKTWKAKDLGRFLGRQYAGEYLQRNEVPLSSQVIQEGIQCVKEMENLVKKSCPELNLKKLRKEIEDAQKVRKRIFNRFIKDTLASVCEQSYSEASTFFEAFGKAIVIKPDELITERIMGVGDKINWTILMLWQQIERLESVAQLHRVLELALKPHGIVVTYKRIEKLCQRIKLKFKRPGRPPKRKIQTNPIVV